MKILNVGEFKENFSAVLDLIRQGKSVSVSYGKKKKRIAVLSPYSEYKKANKIKLGSLSKKASMQFKKDFEINDEELLQA